MATKAVEVAICKGIEYDTEIILEAHLIPDGYIQVSKLVSVEFELLPNGDVVNAEIESIKEAIEETKKKCAKSVQAAEDKIQSLLALPNLTEE